jgi:hypothetical protein
MRRDTGAGRFLIGYTGFLHMGLATGAKLGPYEILAPLGTGGMDI